MNNAILIKYDNTPTNMDKSFLYENTIYFNYNNSEPLANSIMKSSYFFA